MQRVAILSAALVLLGGCEQELSKAKVDLLEAVMFTIEGIEKNTQQKFRFEPVKRTIVGQTVVYTSMGKSAVGSAADPRRVA
jgi:hypothetical protein